MRSIFADSGSWPAEHDRVVVALLSRHGFGAGRLRADPRRLSRRSDQPGGVPGEAGQVDASAGRESRAFSAAPNFAFDLAARKTTDGDLAGLDLGGVLGIISGAERVELATLRALRRSVCALQLSGPHDASLVRLGGGDGLRRRRHLE